MKPAPEPLESRSAAAARVREGIAGIAGLVQGLRTTTARLLDEVCDGLEKISPGAQEAAERMRNEVLEDLAAALNSVRSGRLLDRLAEAADLAAQLRAEGIADPRVRRLARLPEMILDALSREAGIEPIRGRGDPVGREEFDPERLVLHEMRRYPTDPAFRVFVLRCGWLCGGRVLEWPTVTVEPEPSVPSVRP